MVVKMTIFVKKNDALSDEEFHRQSVPAYPRLPIATPLPPPLVFISDR